MTTGAGAGAGFVGRIGELETIRSVVDGARAGTMSALLVHGDAGVGKTRLVSRAAAVATEDGDDVLVLSGACLPLTRLSVPLLPVRTALRDAPPELGSPDLSAMDGADPSGGAPVVVDDWLEQVSRRRPVILVIDDLQWADGDSLDVLLYVLAGSVDRRLAVLLTLRRGEVGADHPVHGWLADLRRMPCFAELGLGPLDRGETREQVAALLGSPPHESLVSEVFSRSGGNAYLTRLLVQGLSPDARHLGPDLPADLRTAVLRPWHRLPEAVRELVLVIAVGGEVAVGTPLARAARVTGVPPEQAPRLLREAVEAGLLDVDARGGGYWFHHPLQAEALVAGVPAEELRLLHAAFAAECEADLAAGPRDDPAAGLGSSSTTAATVASIAAVAHHHDLAGHPLEAYRWTMRAVDAPDVVGTGGERLGLLRRAVALREELTEVEESRLDLLLRLRGVAASLGDVEEELQAVEAVLATVAPDDEPLLTAELIVRREHLRLATGRAFLTVEPPRRAVALAERDARSWQYSYALTAVAHASLWHDEPDAHDLAAAALTRARATGHPKALAYAYAAAAMSAIFQEHDGAAELAARGVAAAVEARDWWAYVHASSWEANAVEAPIHHAWADRMRQRREDLEALGGPHSSIAWMSAGEASSRLYSGAVDECTDRLRVALGSDPGVGAEVMTRLVAARLAALQGRLAEARAHLARAEELFNETSGFLAFEFDAVRAFVAIAADDPEGAVRAAMAGATGGGTPPTMCEWLLPLAARGLADLAETQRHDGRTPVETLAAVDDLVTRFPHTIAERATPTPTYQRFLAGLDALYAAEVARARRADDQPSAWSDAVALLEGMLPWEEAYAAFRAAEVRLVRGRAGRGEAVGMLRRSHHLAGDLRAEPVRRAVEELAGQARIPLGEVTPSSPPVDVPARGRPWHLTPRETEILDHIVAGRTYGEIARALFLSEKTVSSHVSNLLRKTGAANRLELARLARRAVAVAEDTG
ncbi:MAG TPA: AAA family ATPase [Ornithinibacter sp.]|nr:AAA family ATPase [Ornithinibacter sp.]